MPVSIQAPGNLAPQLVSALASYSVLVTAANVLFSRS